MYLGITEEVKEELLSTPRFHHEPVILGMNTTAVGETMVPRPHAQMLALLPVVV